MNRERERECFTTCVTLTSCGLTLDDELVNLSELRIYQCSRQPRNRHNSLTENNCNTNNDIVLHCYMS